MENYNNPAVSITVRKGEGNRDHNIRTFISSNVDKDRIKDNIIFVNEPIQEAYRKCFDEGIRAYNVGKKPSRQKWANMEHPADGYLAKIEKDIAECTDTKRRKLLPKPFYEIIIQIGTMEDYGIFSHPQRAMIAKEILTKYMEDFQKNNPRLYVFCAVLHMDEGFSSARGNKGGTPHLHIDYIAVAKDLKQGLPVRNALTQALSQQGICSGNNKLDNNNYVWQNQQIETIHKICIEYGIITKVVGAEKRGNIPPDQFRALITINEQNLDRARTETDKSIKHSAFGKAIINADKLKEERAVTDVLRNQYHEGLLKLEQEKKDLRSHYLDAEADLQAEKNKAIQALEQARKQAENVDRQRQGEILIARAEQMMAKAESISESAYDDANKKVNMEMERKIREAESRGRKLGIISFQKEMFNLSSRAISAEKAYEKSLKETDFLKNEIIRLETELSAEHTKNQKQAERYTNLIDTVRKRFSKVTKNSKIRLECQQYFKDTDLYEIVKWYSAIENSNPKNNILQH